MARNRKGMKFQVKKMEKLMGINRSKPIEFAETSFVEPVYVGTKCFHVKRYGYGQG